MPEMLWMSRVHTLTHACLPTHTTITAGAKKKKKQQASLVLAEPCRAERCSVLFRWKTTGAKKKKKQRKVCEKEGDRWREGRKSGPQIRKREEEPGENRGAWILWCEGGLETQIGYKLRVVTKIPSCHCVLWRVKVWAYIYKCVR